MMEIEQPNLEEIKKEPNCRTKIKEQEFLRLLLNMKLDLSNDESFKSKYEGR